MNLEGDDRSGGIILPADGAQSFEQRLAACHAEIRGTAPSLRRVAVALYDPLTDTLTSYAHSSDREPALAHYHQPLSQMGALKRLAERRDIRVIDDLAAEVDPRRRHNHVLLAAGMRSSLTVPVHHDRRLMGFLFFNADRARYFTPRRRRRIGVYGRLLGQMLISEVMPLRLLGGALATARALTRFKDMETDGHLVRMAVYMRRLAEALADHFDFSDAALETLYRCAPLHDIGKVAVPDDILLKPGPLSTTETRQMRTHVKVGLGLIDTLIADYGLGSNMAVAVLRAVVGGHHERWDGTGYPHGWRGAEIPPVARIAALADVLDALTSRRPYKGAWPFARAAAHIRAEAGRAFDPVVVAAFDACATDLQALCPDPV